MSHDPVADVIAKLESRGFDPRALGNDSWESRCPVHAGSRRNLSIKRGDDGRALLHCHREGDGLGCDVRSLAEALDMQVFDLFPPDPTRARASTNGKVRSGAAGSKAASPAKPSGRSVGHPTPEGAIAGVIRSLGQPKPPWVYKTADGVEAMRVYRFDSPDGKQYRPVHRDADGWRLGDPPGPLPLYRLPDLAGTRRVYLFEGEKCADMARVLGLVATATAHGSGSPHKTDLSPLAGVEVVIVPDNDPQGEAFAVKVAALLAALDPPAEVKVVHLPNLAEEGDDIEQWLCDVVPTQWTPEQCRDDLEALAEAAPAFVRPLDDDAIEGDEGWPGLILDSMPEAVPFPVDIFPRGISDFAWTVAESIGCRVDLVCLPILIVAGASIGRSVSLALKPGYFASAALYALNVGGPSSGKSPALDAVIRPLLDLDDLMHAQFKLDTEQYEVDMQKYLTSKGDDKPSKPEKPTLGSAVLDNCTVDAVAPLLAANERGLLYARDEGSAWVASIGEFKNGKGSDRQFWMQALFGKRVRVDRKGQAEAGPIVIPHPFLCVIGNIPPEMLNALREPQGRADGFVERILFAYPDPSPRAHWSDHGIPDESRAEWAAAVQTLRALPMSCVEGRSCPHVVQFQPEAKAEWVAFYNAHADEVNRPGYDVDALAAEGKLVEFAGRFALILHMLALAADPTRAGAVPPPELDTASVRGAVRLWTYFRAHHRRARWVMDRGVGNRDAASILAWVGRTSREEFSEKELTDNLRSLAGRPGDLHSALAWLEHRHAIRRHPDPDRPSGMRGRKPSPTYDVHPDLIGGLRNSHNSRNEPPVEPDPR